MKITFLGTGAADWKLEKHKGMEGFRRNCSVLIDDCLLVDPGPNVPDALESFSKEQKNIKYILNSHRHGDHFNQGTMDLLSHAEFFPMKEGEVLSFGKYTVTALKANHGTCAGAVHFIISDGEKKLFYGLDGAWLLYEEVAEIKKEGIDLALLDATVGNTVGDYRIFEHNDLNMVILLKARLQQFVKRFMICHMARTLHASHSVLSDQMKHYGIEVAFDGLEVEI